MHYHWPSGRVLVDGAVVSCLVGRPGGMLKAVQAFVAAFAPGRGRAQRSWDGRVAEWLAAERRRVEQLQALGEALLTAPELDRKEPLDAACARQVELALASVG